ncbi:MAG TPA: hypothetical protein EYP85_02925 [Armatimonadetes bacterium]|nr:hypothetical protein [Armatimonadota bacterium]
MWALSNALVRHWTAVSQRWHSWREATRRAKEKAAAVLSAPGEEPPVEVLRPLEERQEQLWTLALTLIFLLSIGVFLLDLIASVGEQKAEVGPFTILIERPQLYDAERILFLMILLAMAYFREWVKSLRNENRRLYRQSEGQVQRLQEALHELETTQAQLLQSSKLASIGLLAGGVAHELNNPLQIVLGRTELLLEDAPPGSAQHRDLQEIHHELQRMVDIVQNLLAFSRASRRNEMEAVQLNEVVNTTLALLGQQLRVKNIEPHTDLQPDLPPVWGNAGKLQQVLTNLAVNAVQAMPNGGRLEVTTSCLGNQVILRVRDTGCGIPPEHLEHIWDPFFTTKPPGEGTGLGLSVTYGIVKEHGGEIAVSSEVGKGTEFTLLFPPATERQPAVNAGEEESKSLLRLTAPPPPRTDLVAVAKPNA